MRRNTQLEVKHRYCTHLNLQTSLIANIVLKIMKQTNGPLMVIMFLFTFKKNQESTLSKQYARIVEKSGMLFGIKILVLLDLWIFDKNELSLKFPLIRRYEYGSIQII